MDPQDSGPATLHRMPSMRLSTPLRGWELNPRPSPYEDDELPLLYPAPVNLQPKSNYGNPLV